MEENNILTKNLKEILAFDKRLTKIMDKYGTKEVDFSVWHPLKKKIYDWLVNIIVKIVDTYPKSMKIFDNLPLGSLWNAEKKLNEYWKKYGKKWVRKAHEIYSKMSNRELLISLLITKEAHKIVNYIKYFTEVSFDYDKILKSKNPQTLLDVYYYVLKEKATIEKFAVNDYWSEKIKDKANVDKIAIFLLSQMSNDQIMQLANNSDKWESKLFYYGFLVK